MGLCLHEKTAIVGFNWKERMLVLVYIMLCHVFIVQVLIMNVLSSYQSIVISKTQNAFVLTKTS